MQQAKEPFRRLRFGVFEADLRTGELTKQGKCLSLQGQPFRLLALLLEKPGELVTREELPTMALSASSMPVHQQDGCPVPLFGGLSASPLPWC